MKTKNEIINELAINKTIEEIIQNISKKEKLTDTKENKQDLAQDLYVELLSKPEEKIAELYKNNQLKFFITRMVLNNLNSKTSRYHYNYRIHNNDQIEITDRIREEYKEEEYD